MKVIVGSKNISKENSIKIALNNLHIDEYTIKSYSTESFVSSKPIDDDTLKGAINRNNNLLKYCQENNIDFDLLISIEGGYEQIDDFYFIVTYASIIDTNGNNYIGKSQGLQITKEMFEWIKQGKSLNRVIEEILGNESNKKRDGISGFLTNGYYQRDIFDSSAVISAMQSFLNNNKNYKILDKKIKWSSILI